MRRYKIIHMIKEGGETTTSSKINHHRVMGGIAKHRLTGKEEKRICET